ncbi:hypothetical protein [Pontibacter sp. G13]|uniref:hypothetical protein n=1 Tax=Pontibacter sp. G13 TaxID=3074898 RepID=UPI00288C5F8F|nr:hypothetical protein [Pontibacter sp. G13]WNJ17188.1 hypothetical protein RJD25_20215 [Pontibacter sp. G13]
MIRFNVIPLRFTPQYLWICLAYLMTSCGSSSTPTTSESVANLFKNGQRIRALQFNGPSEYMAMFTINYNSAKYGNIPFIYLGEEMSRKPFLNDPLRFGDLTMVGPEQFAALVRYSSTVEDSEIVRSYQIHLKDAKVSNDSKTASIVSMSFLPKDTMESRTLRQEGETAVNWTVYAIQAQTPNWEQSDGAEYVFNCEVRLGHEDLLAGDLSDFIDSKDFNSTSFESVGFSALDDMNLSGNFSFAGLLGINMAMENP